MLLFFDKSSTLGNLSMMKDLILVGWKMTEIVNNDNDI